MNLNFLGDALDHWKGSIFEQLQNANVLMGFAVDAMASDGESWLPDDWELYAKLLRVQQSQFIVHDSNLVADRKSYFNEIGHRGDMFLDPDTGIATSRVNQPSQYLMPDELMDLLSAEKGRIVSVYQHIRARKARDRLEEVIGVIRLRENPFACCSYESGTVAMMFFSRSMKRIQAVVRHFHSELGRHASGRITTWSPQ